MRCVTKICHIHFRKSDGEDDMNWIDLDHDVSTDMIFWLQI
jgi:hypothetical protein